MTDTNKTICKVISTAMFGGAISYSEDIDWWDVFNEMKAHGIASIVGDFIKGIPMNDEIKEKWQDYLLLQLLHWSKVASIQYDVCKIFSEIPYVALKGMGTALLYPSPYLRSIGDVDVLVGKENFEKSCELLKKNNYSVVDENGIRHKGYCKNGIEVEVHSYYSYYLVKDGKTAVEDKILTGLQHFTLEKFEDHEWKALPRFEKGLTLVYHLYHHFIYDGIGLRQIIDWMMFVHNARDIDWCEFNRITKEDGLYKLQCAVTKMCCIYLGLPQSSNIMWMNDADDDICKNLFVYVLSQGNFGRKLSESDLRNRFAYDNKAKGFFARLQLGGMQRWKAAQKHKVLKPFAWLYQGIRISSIMIHRKNPVKVFKSDLDESKKIVKLYDELGCERVDCAKNKYISF